jgi:GT2 family glycosyltransferase
MNDSTPMPAHSMTAQALPPSSLIIPSRGRPELLLDTIQSILHGDQVPSELLIIDQSAAPHPTLGSLATDRSCTIRYIWSRSKGVSHARNQGITAAQHDILVFTDDDMLAAPSWFDTLVRVLMASGPMTVVTGQVRPAEEANVGSFVPSTKTDAAPKVYTGHVHEDVLYSANMALYRFAIDTVGVFDERLGPGTRFGAAEDNDLGYRLLESNYQIIYVPLAVLYHRSWRSNRDFVPLRWNYGFGRGAFYAKHLSLNNHHILRRMLKDVALHMQSGVRRLRTNRQQAFGDIALAFGILLGALRWLIAANWSNPRVRALAPGRDDQQAQKGPQARRG